MRVGGKKYCRMHRENQKGRVPCMSQEGQGQFHIPGLCHLMDKEINRKKGMKRDCKIMPISNVSRQRCVLCVVVSSN